MRYAYIRTRLGRAVVPAAIALLGACSSESLNVGNPNSPSFAGAQNSRAAVDLAIQGVIGLARSNEQGWLTTVGAYGREYYLMQPIFGSTISGNYRDWTIPQNAGLWATYFRNLRNVQQAKIIIDTASATLSAAEKQGALGVLYTFQAIEQLKLLLSRDTLGTVTDVSGLPTDIHPFVSRDSGYSFISSILDSGLVALQGAGPAFSFRLSAGFSGSPGGGFADGATGVDASTPTGFIKVNRALKARVEAYRASIANTKAGNNSAGAANYTAALTALGQSFFTGTASYARGNRGLGVYYTYSAANNDTPNGLFGGNGSFNYLNTTLQTIPNVRNDLRYIDKVDSALAGRSLGSVQGFRSNIEPKIYASNTAPVPLIRNEELILLYAEAKYFTGDPTEALAAINLVRTISGGLAARGAFTSDADFETELLAQRRLSLLLEGHRWVDTRRLLGNAGLPTLQQGYPLLAQYPVPAIPPAAPNPPATPGNLGEPSTYSVATSVPVPQSECDARRRDPNSAALLSGSGCQ